MFDIFDRNLPKLSAKNLKGTPTHIIKEQMGERRPLPLGRKEFEDWSDRLIAGAMIPGGAEDKESFIMSQKNLLAAMILQLGPTEDHKEDAYFIHALRKGCVNQVAHELGVEYREKVKAKLKAKEDAEKAVADALAKETEPNKKRTEGLDFFPTSSKLSGSSKSIATI